jgi:hypothetical protein
VGHYLAGIACGFTMSEFRVGAIRWRRASGWDMTWRWPHPFSGWVKGIPSRPDKALRLRFFLYVLAGPVASIAPAMLVLSSGNPNFAKGVPAFLSACSIGLGLMNLIPAKSGKLRSDGLQLVDAIFGRREIRRLLFFSSYIQAVPLLSQLLRSNKWSEAKAEAQRLLLLSESVSESKERRVVISAVESILELAERGIASVADANDSSSHQDPSEISDVVGF